MKRRIYHIKSKLDHRNAEGILTGLAPMHILLDMFVIFDFRDDHHVVTSRGYQI